MAVMLKLSVSLLGSSHSSVRTDERLIRNEIWERVQPVRHQDRLADLPERLELHRVSLFLARYRFKYTVSYEDVG